MDGSGTVCYIEFSVDGTKVGMDGMWAQEEVLGYLIIGQACSQQAQHLYLTAGQVVGIGRRNA